MATFWEIAAHSVDHVLIVFRLSVILDVSRFGFEGWIWVLIASVMVFASFLLSFEKVILTLNNLFLVTFIMSSAF